MTAALSVVGEDICIRMSSYLDDKMNVLGKIWNSKDGDGHLL